MGCSTGWGAAWDGVAGGERRLLGAKGLKIRRVAAPAVAAGCARPSAELGPGRTRHGGPGAQSLLPPVLSCLNSMGRKRVGTAAWGTKHSGGTGEGSGGQGWVSQPRFCPLDGCWRGKDPPRDTGADALCRGLGEAEVRAGTRGVGRRQGLPPQPQALGIGTRRGPGSTAALRLLSISGSQ